ncbi:3-deoxy-D-manno-octulosonic acid transferase [Mucilaginibacter limnophilus]|uniref:3-deoxy-D-manno-octulosonic acid transferase n=1 Tax=Mucilaginibacter limnophilus TaxID=1932778 RepID=A0A437MKX7_9SPHI|nr:glycosyltransferase N-terminal domain-containing protein [Mucilaginibacter limnophilus]RVT98265.1 3-deoxy-D-manno-octulosonic acid transferase [Mucilaginibacter limnophilus]
MILLYNIGVRSYYSLLFIASFFNKKAKQWINGRKAQSFVRYPGSIWFHFASLGEFEQGRPVLEKLKEKHPGRKIVITFFSPSGYEIRKNTHLADAVYYLPLDTDANARRFIESVQPNMAIFTKYEYWYHFFHNLHKRQIPLYIISGIFRPEQVFFKWYGGLHRRILGFVSHFFLQDDNSKRLLQGIGINNATVSGDTRFDRVWANAQNPKPLLEIAAFAGDSKVFICGSTWPADEQLLAHLITKHPSYKFIFAPHEVEEARVAELAASLQVHQVLRYSHIVESTVLDEYNVLIIDNIGMLSSLYQYGHISYIGGGFGVGIHNTLEAAAFGLPVIFGPNYSRFKEAKDLIPLHAGFSINNENELETVAGKLINDETFYALASQNAAEYVERQKGATEMILAHINA